MSFARPVAKILRWSAAAFLCTASLAAVPPEPAGGEPPAALAPSELVSIPGTSDVLVVGTVPCGTRSCVQLWRVGAGGRHLTPLAVPPSARASAPGLVEGAHLVFADVEHGYALAGEGGGSWYTADGGLAWHPLPKGLSRALVAVVASGETFYGLLGSCTTMQDCRYRLGRSAVTAPHWSSVPVPGAAGLVQGNIDLAASGPEVWLTFEPGSKPVLAKSHLGRPPFQEQPAPQLLGVVGCSLDPENADVVWAKCPTGMMVSWWRSTDGGAHFTHWWETSGTGGNAFDPLSATVAYRYTGIGPGPAYVLQRTADGGASFTTVCKLFSGEGSTPQFVFSNQDDGYALGANEPGTPAFQFLYTSDGGRQWRPVLNI
jgi:hypothetical protein